MSPRTLSVFEHQTLRIGEPAGGESSLCEHEFQALVRFNDSHGSRFFTVGHRRITFRQYVGYVQVGDLGIEVLPKADRRAVRDGDTVRWHDGLLRMLEVALGMRLEQSSSANQKAARASLLDLVAHRFSHEVTNLLRQGLVRGYRREEANHTTFRGRLLVAENLRHNLVRPDRFFVRYHTYDRDVLVNQLLGAAFEALQELPLAASVAARAAECRALFPEVTSSVAAASDFDRLVFDRNTERYRTALVLARMILEQRAPQLRAGSLPVFGLLFDMNVLWERYVAALFRKTKIPGLSTTAQSQLHFWKVPGARARTIRPDIIVSSDERPILAVDTKWKLARDGSPSDDDLKQMFAYNEMLGVRQALLVYPGTGELQTAVNGSFTRREHRCGTLFLGLFARGRWSTAEMQEQVRCVLLEEMQRQRGLELSASP